MCFFEAMKEMILFGEMLKFGEKTHKHHHPQPPKNNKKTPINQTQTEYYVSSPIHLNLSPPLSHNLD